MGPAWRQLFVKDRRVTTTWTESPLKEEKRKLVKIPLKWRAGARRKNLVRPKNRQPNWALIKRPQRSRPRGNARIRWGCRLVRRKIMKKTSRKASNYTKKSKDLPFLYLFSRKKFLFLSCCCHNSVWSSNIFPPASRCSLLLCPVKHPQKTLSFIYLYMGIVGMATAAWVGVVKMVSNLQPWW